MARTPHATKILLAVAALAAVVASTGACSGDSGASAAPPDIPMAQQLGTPEGRLDMVVWTGYAENGSNDKKVDWVTPFTKATGCKVTTKVADTSDAMVALMETGRYDGVSASGDASLRLVHAGLVAPVNTGLIGNYADIAGYLKNQPYNSVNGQMYGVPHGYGANVLMYRTDKFQQRPTSWSVIWDEDSPAAGHVVAYDSPIYIADAALYLKTHRPDLEITDVYALDEEQFAAAVDLLKRQRPNVNQYFVSYLDELHSFTSGYNYAGIGWQVTANLALAEKAPVATTIPVEGATGWSDTWMISSKAQHPTCMYKWMNWITAPKVQAQVAQWFGEAPANPKACRYTAKGFCSTFRVGDQAFYKRLAFWRTPTKDCGDDRGDSCVEYSRWAQAWTQIKG
ncbi:extracellular solute-binding protein [Actinomadura sp. KC06]|uniref:ABC transporter substrate-binding protein n=1 Tax=Actinomadura sp. KC06 TaxID=2530369 RepID=UPI0010526D61|nr:ABC transporter substrate-binding protein [Actinomadura sp. KC06]TDD35090.1 extracellular solute-binding protein [Actinomadura sp. KC06]